MTIYIINEDANGNELKSIQDNLDNTQSIKLWPQHTDAVPSDTESSILIMKEENSTLDEKRVINIINKGIRIICIYIEEVNEISSLAKKYCSVKVPLLGSELLDAINGNDSIQQDQKGADAPNNPQKRHSC